jgi:uncharacterized repeat protein (TIGR03803 family)
LQRSIFQTWHFSLTLGSQRFAHGRIVEEFLVDNRFVPVTPNISPNRFTGMRAVKSDVDPDFRTTGRRTSMKSALTKMTEITGRSVRGANSALALVIVLAIAVVATPLAQAQTFTVLHSFTGGKNDGGNPYGGLVTDAFGNLYGTTFGGGDSGCGDGCGTVFKVDTKGNESVLYKFTGGKDGGWPSAGLRFNTLGNLYGTASVGGSNGDGVVFKLSPPTKKGGKWTEKPIYSFTGGSQGADPVAGLAWDGNGNLYGTTMGTAGEPNHGTVFELDPKTGAENTPHTFTGGTDGLLPYAGLLKDSEGNFYGTTAQGGDTGCGLAGCGTVFTVDSAGAYRQLHAFTGGKSDGAGPGSGFLVMDAAGYLWGTTGGGGNGYGVVFKMDTTGTLTIAHTFCQKLHCTDGAGPQAGLVMDAAGNLYGTSSGGGSHRSGTVFKLDTTGAFSVLYSFNGSTDGVGPVDNPILDSTGTVLYGTSSQGGNKGCIFGCGTVWMLKL